MDVPEFDSFTLREFIDALARKDPAPGGGCAAATAGAMAAGLVGMVARVAINRADNEADKSEMIRTAEQADSLRARLTDLINLDAKAYRSFKNAQPAQLREAWQNAILVPLDIASQSLAVLEVALLAVQWSPVHTLSDVAAASALAVAGVEGGTSTVETNVTFAPHGADGESFRAKASDLLSLTRNLRNEMEAVLAGRFGKS